MKETLSSLGVEGKPELLQEKAASDSASDSSILEEWMPYSQQFTLTEAFFN